MKRARFEQVNSLFFFAIIFYLLKSITKSRKHATTAAKSRATGRAFLVLLPLLGLTFFLGYAAQNTAVMHIYALINPLMGILLCIFNFFLDKSVQTAYQDYKRKRAAVKGFHGNFNSMQLSKVNSTA